MWRDRCAGGGTTSRCSRAGRSVPTIPNGCTASSSWCAHLEHPRDWSEAGTCGSHDCVLEIRTASRPVRLDVDPEFDIMRRLDALELHVEAAGAAGYEQRDRGGARHPVTEAQALQVALGRPGPRQRESGLLPKPPVEPKAIFWRMSVTKFGRR